MSSDFNGGWIVARAKPRQELYARENVVRQGFECYVPQFLDKFTRRVLVLFPGYIFVNTPGPWTFLTGTFGVMDVVLSGGGPATLPLKIIDELRARENRKGYVDVPEERFAVDQPVRLLSGPFAGSVCLYQGTTAKDRIKVLMAMLGGYTPVIVKERQVEAA